MNITGSLNEMAAARRHSPHGLVDSSVPVWHLSFLDSEGFTSDRLQSAGSWTTEAAIGTAVDGLLGSSTFTTDAGTGDEIVTAANFSGGAGGRGFRHWRGDGDDKNGGGLTIRLYDSGGSPTIYYPNNPSAPINELWVRWYSRYEAGFQYTSTVGGPVNYPTYTKELFFNSNAATARVAVGYHSSLFGVSVLTPSSQNLYSSSTTGWTAIMGGDVGDGLWHFFEVYWRTDTNRANGLITCWVDGVEAHSNTNVDMATEGVRYFWLGHNQAYPTNGGTAAINDRYTDFDEVAVSLSGPIGPYDSARGY